MIEGHGDDTHRYAGKIVHNFSSNVYYKGCPRDLLAKISSRVQTIQNYPSPAARELNEVAAMRYGISVDHFLFTNGATEAFYLIAQLFSDERVAIIGPTFSEYEDACKIHGLKYQLVNRSALDVERFGLVFICNPNNPDGRVLQTGELITWIENNPATTFVIDEAYIEFTRQVTSLAPEVKRFSNLIIVRSLTKTFAIPGLRLGYVMTSTSLIKQLLSKKMPWSVNALAIAAGLSIFQHYDKWQFKVEELLQETQDLMSKLSRFEWLALRPSYTSYFLVELKKGTAAALKGYLAEQHSILVRDATNFNGLEGEYIRLATQSPEANQALINALDTWN